MDPKLATMKRAAAGRKLLVAASVLAGLGAPGLAEAHCDTTKGPVVTAARTALERRDPRLVLHWVRAEDEPAVRRAFQEALTVRALGPAAKALADRHFFETVVRLHRAGEGAPYTGLKDTDPEPIIAATDRALAEGSRAKLEETLVRAVKEGLARRFASASKARRFRQGDVAAGRAYVAAYVPLAHWVEGILAAAEGHGGSREKVAHPPSHGHDQRAGEHAH
ncbi:MAG: hypothetical protein IT371_22410 [Deltaproteobacteria bacterium]|nr:hypothetical protein [Deltaproteobacteria bacterium]